MTSEWDPGRNLSCWTQLWPFHPAWWVGHGLGSTVLIFLPPLSFPLPPSLPPFLLEIRALRCPLNVSRAGFLNSLQRFSFIFCDGALPCCPGESHPWAEVILLLLSPTQLSMQTCAAACTSQRMLLGKPSLCVLSALDRSRSSDLLCTSYLFLNSIISLWKKRFRLIIWNKVWSQETHQRPSKRRSHHPA